MNRKKILFISLSIIYIFCYLFQALSVADVSNEKRILNAKIIPSFNGTSPLDTYIAKGGECLNKGDYNQASLYFQKAVRLDPNNFQAYFRLGIAYFLLHQTEKAILCFKKAIKISPNNAKAYLGLGIAYISSHKVQKSIYYLNRSIQINPGNAQAFCSLGIAYESLNQFKKAEINFQKADELFKNKGDVLNAQKTEQILKEVPHIAYYVEAIRKKPNDGILYLNIGVAYNLSYQPQIAISYLKKAIQINPKDHDTYYSLGVAYDGLRQSNQAITNFKKAIQLNSLDAKSYFSLGLVYKSLKQFKEAGIYLQKARELFHQEGELKKEQATEKFLRADEINRTLLY